MISHSVDEFDMASAQPNLAMISHSVDEFGMASAQTNLAMISHWPRHEIFDFVLRNRQTTAKTPAVHFGPFRTTSAIMVVGPSLVGIAADRFLLWKMALWKLMPTLLVTSPELNLPDPLILFGTPLQYARVTLW